MNIREGCSLKTLKLAVAQRAKADWPLEFGRHFTGEVAFAESIGLLREYADKECGGFCGENGGVFDDCGGCKARVFVEKHGANK